VPIAERADTARGAEGTRRLPLTIVDSDHLRTRPPRWRGRYWRGGARHRTRLRSWLWIDDARRVRALLERAQISVRDETGWRLSTTSAAAAVMRWYDLVADDLYWRDLLDWLKSSFTLSEPARQGAADPRVRACNPHSWRAAGGARDAAGTGGTPARRLIGAGGRRARGAGAAGGTGRAITQRRPTLPAHARALQTSLEALGMRTALAADPVGRDVLRESMRSPRNSTPPAGGHASRSSVHCSRHGSRRRPTWIARSTRRSPWCRCPPPCCAASTQSS